MDKYHMEMLKKEKVIENGNRMENASDEITGHLLREFNVCEIDMVLEQVKVKLSEYISERIHLSQKAIIDNTEHLKDLERILEKLK